MPIIRYYFCFARIIFKICTVQNKLMPEGMLNIKSEIFQFRTNGEIDIIDLTPALRQFIDNSGITEGRVTVFCTGSTGAIACTEYESGLLQDNKKILKNLIPRGSGYKHDEIDNNAHSHLRSTLLGSEITIPVINGRLVLGTWQQVVFFELDVRKRNRQVVFQIMGIKQS